MLRFFPAEDFEGVEIKMFDAKGLYLTIFKNLVRIFVKMLYYQIK